MATVTATARDESAGQTRAVGWFFITLGLGVVGWWIWAWAKVDTVISDHVATHGSLPVSEFERAALYGEGTLAEQALSSRLEDMSGLYPWGRLPLVVGVLMAVVGWLASRTLTNLRIAVAAIASVLLLTIPLNLFGDSMRIALDILE